MQTGTTTQQQPDNKSLALQRIANLQTVINEDYVQSQLKGALAESSASFAASIIDLVTSDKNLQECDPKLVMMQAMKAAMLKLPINKSLGFGFIVAYKGRPEFQIGYKGLIQLAIRTGQYKHLNADIVYKGMLRSKNVLTGEFDFNGTPESDEVIGYFAHFEMTTGFSKTLYMTKERVLAHAKKYSKSFGNSLSPWQTEFDAMALKTVLRNLLSHYGYLSVETANLLDKEDAADRVNDEINNHANQKPLNTNGFEEAETTFQQQSGPGF